jgi:ATP-dependent DNA ligase
MDFEGEIPSGLGKGKVTIWDKGHLDILKIKDGHVHLRALEGKIRGDWVIVNTGKKQSLIIAKTPISIASWTKPSYNRKVVEKLKDLQRDPNLRIETKLDGAALEIRVGAEYSTISSHRISKRTGTTIDHSDRIVGIRGIKSSELDGTVLRVEGFHPEGVEFLAGTLNSGVIKARLLQKQHGPIRTAVFDILKYKGQDVSHLPYQQRRALYESVCRQLKSKLVRPVDQAVVDIATDDAGAGLALTALFGLGEAFFAHFFERGVEVLEP